MKRRTLYLSASVLIVATAAVGLWRARGGSTAGHVWGRRPLTTSERAYYSQRIQRILTALAQTEHHTEREDSNQTGPFPFVCLVADTTKRQMWIESDGRILPEYRTELPPRLEWSVCRSDANGLVELPMVTRFRAPRTCDRPLREERFSLVGHSRGEELTFEFSPSGPCGSGYARGLWVGRSATHSTSGTSATDAGRESFVLAETDYEEARMGFGPSDVTSIGPAVLRENLLAWTRAEKRLYQEVEKAVSESGYRLSILELHCGPDYTAASATITAHGSSLIPGFTFYPRAAQALLKVDSLGRDIWYVKSAPCFRLPLASYLDLEALVAAQGTIPERDVPALLQAGRDKQQRIAQPPPSKWRVNLPFGATFEFLGLCRNPSAGRPWWGPDGSPLDEAPHVNHETCPCRWQDHVVYEVAWRIQQPPAGQPRVSAHMVGASTPLMLQDHYGDSMPPEQSGQGYAFPRTWTKANLKVVAQTEDESTVLAALVNISLIPGVDPGFEIVLGDTRTR